MDDYKYYIYIFFFAPYCFLGNIILAVVLDTLSFLFLFFLDIFTITWRLSANGLREYHKLNNPHNKLLMAEKTTT